MDNSEDILTRAHQRGVDLTLPYSGALLPKEAHRLAETLPGAKIIDVRTKAEWDWVGRIPGALMIEWSTYPGGDINPDFLRELAARVPGQEAPLMFICRSGHRSHYAAAAATRAGFANCYNVLEGFEGEKDASGHRNRKNGWRFAGLPWEQS